MMREETRERYWLLRIGSVAAVAGALLAAVGNLLHPVTPRDDPEGVARVIAESDAWTLIHIVIIIGLIAMLGGLVAIRHSIEGGVAEALARLGIYAATVGATLGILTVVLDGVGAKQLANQWAAASGSERAFAIAGMFNLSFAGVPFILLGLAAALSGAYPAWLGWAAAAAGVFSIGAGLVQAFTGKPTTASLILTIIGPTVISAWVLVMGVLIGRKATRMRASPA